jgi:hypothetical protein
MTPPRLRPDHYPHRFSKRLATRQPSTSNVKSRRPRHKVRTPPDLEPVQEPHEIDRRDSRMRTLVQRLKRLWDTPVEFYGIDRPEPQAGSWHGLLLFVVLLVVLGLLWLIRYLPERTYLV